MKNPIKQITATLLAAAMLVTPFLTGYARTDSDWSWGTPTDAPSTPAAATGPATAASSGTGFTSSSKVPFSKMSATIKEYQQTNKDVVGWLRIPNTNINEPIVHSGQNNSYYEKRDWKGTNYPNNNYQNFVQTATFSDYRTVWGDTWAGTSRNIVLYGHNWTNLRSPLDIGSNNNHIMFGQLPSYTNLEFAKSNPYVYFSTAENEGIFKVFGVAYCELSTSFNYNRPNGGPENRAYLISEWKQRSMHNFDVDVASSDTLLTLSTCTRAYGNHSNQRFVVVARMLRDGESDTQTVNVTANTNMKSPKL